MKPHGFFPPTPPEAETMTATASEHYEGPPAFGQHCPSESCGGVIDDECGNCSHCGQDHTDDG